MYTSNLGISPSPTTLAKSGEGRTRSTLGLDFFFFFTGALMIAFPDLRLEGMILSKSTSSSRPGVEVLMGMSVSLALVDGWWVFNASSIGLTGDGSSS